MRLFIIKTTIYSFCLVLLCTGIELYARSIPNTYTYKIDYLRKNAADIEVLIMGHSHAFNGINPHLFGKNCFNMAMAGQGVAIDEFLLKQNIDKFKSLKIIILSYTYNSFIAPAAYGNKNAATYFNIYYKYHKNWLSKNYYEFLSDNLKIKLLHHWNDKTLVLCDSFGYSGTEIGTYRDDLFEVPAMYNDMNIDMLNPQRFENIAQMCAEREIKLVLVTPPSTIDYQELLIPDRLKMMYDLVTYLSKEYKNISYFDYSNDSISYDKTCFFNSAHLNAKGAEFFTKKLMNDIGLKK